MQIVASNGQQTVSDVSQGAFSVAPAGNAFYVSATGSDSNSGKSPDAPMASLGALLNVYALLPGDTIYVGAGTYTTPSAILLGPSDSGAAGDPIQIIGQGATTIFKSASNATSTSVFEFDGGHDISLENMALVGGGIGVNIIANSGGDDVSLQGLDISGFSSMGVDVGAGATNFSITGSNIHDPLTARNYDGIDIDLPRKCDHQQRYVRQCPVWGERHRPIGLTINNNIFTTNYDGVNINIDRLDDYAD